MDKVRVDKYEIGIDCQFSVEIFPSRLRVFNYLSQLGRAIRNKKLVEVVQYRGRYCPIFGMHVCEISSIGTSRL